MSDVCVIGAGAFGTALPELVAQAGDNKMYLPGFPIPGDVQFTNDMETALAGAELVLLVVPSSFMRSVSKQAAPFVPKEALIISTAKGIERESLALMSDVLAETLPRHTARTTYLSGPTFARDLACGLPADATLAASDIDVARQVQEILHAPQLRLYASDDVIGVELGGALKNVIAVGCGAAAGLGLGASSVASLMTRGLAELTRLGVALGANPLTFLGLAGVGDLTLTCTGDLSRNRTLGIQLATGKSAREVIASQRAVAEGYYTSVAVHALSQKTGVEMPISEAIYRVCHEDASLSEEATRLMSREAKDELEGIFLVTKPG